MIIYKLREHRKAAGLTQEQLANEAGVARETIIRLEKGLYNPSLEISYKICSILKCDIVDTFVYNPDQIIEEQDSTKEKRTKKDFKMNMPSDYEELYLYKEIYDTEYQEFCTYCIKRYHADITKERFLGTNISLYTKWYREYLDKYFI